MADIKNQLKTMLVTSQKSKDSKQLAVLRQISAGIKQFEIDNKVDAKEQDLIQLFAKMIKQRQESISQFEKANRQDLIAQENYELEIIQQFLPPALSENELQVLIKDAINITKAQTAKDIGKVLGQLKPKIIGRADMGKVSASIKKSLSN